MKKALSAALALGWALVFPALVLVGVWQGLFKRWMALGLAAKAYPVAVNLALLASFGWSLRRPPTVIERMARLQEPDLPAYAVAYTRRVTQAWCLFFLLNAAVSSATALWATEAVWALYNGVIAYGLMGLMFAAEWLIRGRVRRRNEAQG